MAATTSIASILSGQVAGFDAQAAVEGILGLKQFEINQVQKKQDAITTKQNAFVELNTMVGNLRNTAIGMADSAAFFGYTASLSSSSSAVSASSLLDVSGTSGLAAGQHNIVVSQVAQSQRLSSSAAITDNVGAALADATSALNVSGSFLLEGLTVTVATSDSLNQIASNINQLNTGSSPSGVTASVMKVADNDFRLILASDATGAAGFTLSGTDLDVTPLVGTLSALQLGAVGQSNAQQSLQTAQDAQFSIDGLAMTRSSNTVSDVLSGVTLSLKQADPTVTISMNIGVDSQALRDNVQTFVDSYNSLQLFLNDQYKFDANTGTSATLAGEAIVGTILGQMSSSLLNTIPTLASDRNSLVMIGIEPDQTGQLMINENLFGNFLATDPNAIRDVFVAQGTSSNTSLSYLTNGLTTPSGRYVVDVTQAATKAVLTGVTDLSVGLVADEVVTITDTNSARQSIVNLTAGQTQSQIIAALNASFISSNTEQHQLSTALLAGAAPSTGATTFAALDLAAAISAGDTITISGTLRSGSAVSSSYSVIDPAVDTISSLLTAIQSAFNQEVTASVDANGRITLIDSTAGDSSLTVSLTANNEGLGSLTFGSDTVVTEGRYPMPVVAVVAGNSISIESTSYGATSSFSIIQRDALGVAIDGLGIADTSAAGLDVLGTINGLSALGKGQTLIGSSGNVDGLAILYAGASTGAVGDLSLGIGVGAAYEGLLDLFTNPVTGIIKNSINTDQTQFDSLTLKIAQLTEQMDQQRVILTGQFTRMQQAMASLQLTGDFFTQQTNARING